MEQHDAGGGNREWRLSARRHELGLEVGTAPGADVLTVTGALDAQTHDQFRALFKDGGPELTASHLVVDLGAVDFIDSSGLGALIVAEKSAGARGATTRLVATAPPVVRLLRITRIDQSIATHATLDEALAALG